MSGSNLVKPGHVPGQSLRNYLASRRPDGRPRGAKRFAVVKGFAFGIPWNELGTERNNAVAKLKEYDAIVWDGDLRKGNSFTTIIGDVLNQQPNKEFYAIVQEQQGANKLYRNVRNTGKRKVNKGVPVSAWPSTVQAVILPEKKNENLNLQMVSSIIGENAKPFELKGLAGLRRLVRENPGATFNVIFYGGGEIAKIEKGVLGNSNKKTRLLGNNAPRVTVNERKISRLTPESNEQLDLTARLRHHGRRIQPRNRNSVKANLELYENENRPTTLSKSSYPKKPNFRARLQNAIGRFKPGNNYNSSNNW